MATRTSPQGSAGSSPHHISGTIEAMVASTSQFPAGVYPNRFGYQNSSAAVGCSAPRRQFSPRCMSGYPYSPHCQNRWRTNALLPVRLPSAASGAGRPGHEERLATRSASP
jgi:hypothetical protein